MQLSYNEKDTLTGLYRPNLTSYEYRVGAHPSRKTNLYFSDMVMVRALQKVAHYLSRYPIVTGDPHQDALSKKLLEKLTLFTVACPNLFNETLLFQGPASSVNLFIFIVICLFLRISIYLILLLFSTFLVHETRVSNAFS